MWFAAAVGSALLFGLAGWWMKVSQMRGGSSSYLLLGLYISGTIGFGVHAAVERTLLPDLTDWRVWAAGLLIGAGSALGNALFMKALESGPASLTSPLTNMNIVLVIGLGTFVYNEPFTSMEMSGVLLLLAAVVLISIRGNEQLTITSRNWYLYVGLSVLLFAVRNGGLKVTEEMGLSGAPILLIAYALSIIWFGAAAYKERNAMRSAMRSQSSVTRNMTTPDYSSSSAIGMRLGLISGLFSYGGLQLYTIALQTGQANIAGPIFASNSLVVAVGSIVLYRERLSLLQWIAFVLMFAGLILIRL
ncbi:DMT family transporter [Paenibacillus spongiae]|uniref:DMT family transporter n=1 Tax=Paenibacillus spongiae TaxID=2909671 RepID=A0ABY5SDP6_9BACL|nr:DMT family transporter [Paenibacillus spongiae]UVI31769.1 DMT family transporter [Paenibacillus spongiae]